MEKKNIEKLKINLKLINYVYTFHQNLFYLVFLI